MRRNTYELGKKATPADLSNGGRGIFWGGLRMGRAKPYRLFRTENAVAGVAQAGDDVGVFVEVVVERRHEDF